MEDIMGKDCDHDFRFLESKRHALIGDDTTKWVKAYFYYCTRCLAEKKIVKTVTQKETPEWYKTSINGGKNG
jgi:hypothetical protein